MPKKFTMEDFMPEPFKKPERKREPEPEPEPEPEGLFQLWSNPATDVERDIAIGLVLNHLGLQVMKNNRELILEKEPSK